MTKRIMDEECLELILAYWNRSFFAILQNSKNMEITNKNNLFLL